MLPIVGTPVNLLDLLPARGNKDILKSKISNLLNTKFCFLSNCAKTSFYFLLKSLKKLYPDKNEVILPAYTDYGLVLAIKKAGLSPVFCDISLSDFNIDIDKANDLTSKKTLCVLVVHMFGIPANIEKLTREVFVIEDCAQAFGSKINNRLVGSFGDGGFFSFGRGKNLPTYYGGVCFLNSEEIAYNIKEYIKSISDYSVYELFRIVFLNFAFYLVMKPVIYSIFHGFLSKFKSEMPPNNFSLKNYTDYQAGIALSLIDKLEEFSEKRYNNGMLLIKELGRIKGIILPEINSSLKPSFNRLPIIVKDAKMKASIMENLYLNKIEISEMYKTPLFSLPNANILANNLLTLPTHPLVEKGHISKVIEVITKCFQQRT